MANTNKMALRNIIRARIESNLSREAVFRKRLTDIMDKIKNDLIDNDQLYTRILTDDGDVFHPTLKIFPEEATRLVRAIRDLGLSCHVGEYSDDRDRTYDCRPPLRDVIWIYWPQAD